MVDLGTGNNNKINWAMDNKQEVNTPLLPSSTLTLMVKSTKLTYFEHCVQLIDIIETVYRGAAKGRGLVVSPKGNSASLQ